MPIDSYVQVAQDGSGKQVDMSLTSTAAGASIYRQRAEIVGDVSQMFNALIELQQQQLRCLRAILASVTSGAAEDDFSGEGYN